MKNYLNFETEIKNLEVELDKLKDPYNQDGLSEVDTQNISKLQNEIDSRLKEIYSNLNPWQIFNSLKKTYKFGSKDFTIIGYTPDLSTARSVQKIIGKQNNILLDPVMGDIGIGLYVNKDVANFFKKMILKVSYVSANFFEWSYLNGKNVNSYSLQEVLFDLKKFSTAHNIQLFIRSIPFEGKLLNTLCKKNQVWGISTPYINFKNRFHGAGDLSTALYADNLLRKNSLKKTLENVTKDIFIHLSKYKNKRRKKIVFRAKNLSNL